LKSKKSAVKNLRENDRLSSILFSAPPPGREIKPCSKFWRKRCVKKLSHHLKKREAALAALRKEVSELNWT